MLNQRALQLERAEAIIRGLEHVIGTPDVRVVAVGVAAGDVAGVIGPSLHDARGARRVIHVASHQADGRGIQADADLAIGRFVPPGVQQNDVVSRSGHTGGTWLDFLSGKVADDEHGLGLSETVANGQAPCLPDFLNDFRIERFSGAHQFLALNGIRAQVLEHQQTPYRWG